MKKLLYFSLLVVVLADSCKKGKPEIPDAPSIWETISGKYIVSGVHYSASPTDYNEGPATTDTIIISQTDSAAVLTFVSDSFTNFLLYHYLPDTGNIIRFRCSGYHIYAAVDFYTAN